jgi:DNA-binding MarR family transcriptional regulator
MQTLSLQSDIGKKTGFDSPAQQAYLNLAYTHAQLAAQFASLFKAHDLSEATYNILRVLRGVRKLPENGKDALPCGEIGERLIARVPDVTRLIDRLVKAGLVDRIRGEDDRRVVLARITTKGLALLRKLDTPVLELHDQTLGHLSKTELKQLNNLLERARQIKVTTKTP